MTKQPKAPLARRRGQDGKENGSDSNSAESNQPPGGKTVMGKRVVAPPDEPFTARQVKLKIAPVLMLGGNRRKLSSHTTLFAAVLTHSRRAAIGTALLGFMLVGLAYVLSTYMSHLGDEQAREVTRLYKTKSLKPVEWHVASEALDRRTPAFFRSALEDDELGEVLQEVIKSTDAVVADGSLALNGYIADSNSLVHYSWDPSVARKGRGSLGEQELRQREVLLRDVLGATNKCSAESNGREGCTEETTSSTGSAYSRGVDTATVVLASLPVAKLPTHYGVTIAAAVQGLNRGLRDKKQLDLPLGMDFATRARAASNSSLVVLPPGHSTHGELLRNHRIILQAKGTQTVALFRSDSIRNLGLFHSNHPRHHQAQEPLYRRREDPLPTGRTSLPSGLQVQLGESSALRFCLPHSATINGWHYPAATV